jgi:Phospholipase_D-nuclease N-terminal
MQLLTPSVPKLSSIATALIALMQRDNGSPAAACGCLGFFGFVIVAIIALNIALLIWVARDAKSRGMDSAILWMILVMFTGIIGLIIYLFSRPQGNVVRCSHCGNNRLQVSAKCPHCGNV